MRRPTAGEVTAAVLLVLGMLYGYLAGREGIGTVEATGPGFFPLLVAASLILSSGTVLMQQFRRGRTPTAQSGADDPGDETVYWARVIAVLAASLAVPVLAETIGFVVTLSAAVSVIAKVMGTAGWLRPLLLGAGFGAASWLVFVYWLFVPLPPGVLGLA